MECSEDEEELSNLYRDFLEEQVQSNEEHNQANNPTPAYQEPGLVLTVAVCKYVFVLFLYLVWFSSSFLIRWDQKIITKILICLTNFN